LRAEPAVFGNPAYTLMASTDPTAEASFHLAPGRYRVEARNGAVARSITLTLPPAGSLRREMVLGAGELRLDSRLDHAGPPAERTWFRILRDEQDAYGRPRRREFVAKGYAPSADFLLPAGHYLVEASCGDARVEMPLEISAGATTKHDLVLDAGRLELTASLSDGGDAAVGTVFSVSRQLSDRPGEHGWLAVARSGPAAEITYILPAGRYRVQARRGHAVHQVTLDLHAGQTATRHLILDAGELELVAVLAGRREPLRDVRFEVTPAHMPAATRAIVEPVGADQRARLTLPAGRYDVVARYGEGETSRTVEVGAGSRAQLALDLDAGRVTLSLAAAGGGRPYPATWFSVFRIEGGGSGQVRRRVYHSGYYASTDLILPAGQYLAYAHDAGHRGQLSFQVDPGDVKQLSIIAGR
jgi:hypothetical protein